jgi:hypothetical protein
MMHRRAPGLSVVRALDVAVPAPVAARAFGKLIACRFMVNAGSPPTTAWDGLVYAGQARAPAPVPPGSCYTAPRWYHAVSPHPPGYLSAGTGGECVSRSVPSSPTGTGACRPAASQAPDRRPSQRPSAIRKLCPSVPAGPASSALRASGVVNVARY